MLSLQKQLRIALSLFFIAVLAGLFLRFLFVADLEVVFKYVVHAHSHVALLGWVYTALILLVYKLILKKFVPPKVYKRIFYFTLFTVIGMLFSFPFQGYAAVSITFSTLFLFASYAFYWAYLKYIPKEDRQTPALKCINYALFYMVVSSLGPWAVGGVMATLGPNSDWYRVAIYFYLHLQYNAWMILALVGVFLYIIEQRGVYFSKRNFSRFILSFHVSIVLTFFLSVLFLYPPTVVYVLAVSGGVVQFMAFGYLYKFLKKRRFLFARRFSKLQQQMLSWLFVLLIGKLIFQFIGAFPQAADFATVYKNLTIGFLHWVFLGLVSIGLFFLLNYYRLLRLSFLQFRLYILAFVLTEILIFFSPFSKITGFPFPDSYYWWVFLASLFFVLVIGSIFLSNLSNKKRPPKGSLSK